jgi:hypothetical protein
MVATIHHRQPTIQLGLDLPERRIGLSAHDFAQLLGVETYTMSNLQCNRSEADVLNKVGKVKNVFSDTGVISGKVGFLGSITILLRLSKKLIQQNCVFRRTAEKESSIGAQKGMMQFTQALGKDGNALQVCTACPALPHRDRRAAPGMACRAVARRSPPKLRSRAAEKRS